METKQIIRPWWASVFFIALGSALFLTVQNIVDSIINQKYAVASDKLTAASAYLFIGGWVGVIICILLGRLITKVSKHWRTTDKHPLNQPKRWGSFSSVSLAILAGILGAISTLIQLWGYQLNDLGVMVAMTNAFILVIVITEWVQRRVTLRSFLFPSLLVVGSIVLIAYNSTWRTNTSVLLQQAPELLVVLLGFSVFNAFGSIVSKSAVDNSNSVNVQLIRFVTLAITGSILTFGWAALRNQTAELIQASLHIATTPAVYLLLILLFVAVFASQILELEAKKQNTNVTEVVIVQSLNVGLGFVAAMIINLLWSGAVGPVPTDTETIIVRIVGVVGLMLALTLLPRKVASKNQ
ncbi:hypothetical protein C5B42_04395 [Candidatus Cerribacteria bacterium 'Amazon FNV 2010 28 9']|uniref:EamA domain-containing protein n=1 Tax=Candidatus Cerribacteria bacterium 'Amazon FNV 2010 28 9' TaxID=2081795 RepID=A0A317JS65_9BACT|nr:MAG: hypothetical protein C5B42_04395 [Candidatus Cerribacteria bacterium 'Amazon FNV 2010 28 9']